MAGSGFGPDFYDIVLDKAREPLADVSEFFTSLSPKDASDPIRSLPDTSRNRQFRQEFAQSPVADAFYTASGGSALSAISTPKGTGPSRMPYFGPTTDMHGAAINNRIATPSGETPTKTPMTWIPGIGPTEAPGPSGTAPTRSASGYYPVVTNASSDSYVTDTGTHAGGPAADIFAPEGSPIYAPVGGTVVAATYSKGGNTAILRGDDGRWYYMAHGAVPFVGGRVEGGQQIGQVGTTGNAAGGRAHVHFAVADAADSGFTLGVNGGSGDIWFGPEMWSTGGGTPTRQASPGGIERTGQLAFDPDTPIWTMADAYSRQYGLRDANVLRALILAESGGDPTQIGDNGNSIGLLQNNMAGGRGQGHSRESLLDPNYNLSISMPEISAAYRRALSEGYEEGTPEFAMRIGQIAQRPRPDLIHRYADAYVVVSGGRY